MEAKGRNARVVVVCGRNECRWQPVKCGVTDVAMERPVLLPRWSEWHIYCQEGSAVSFTYKTEKIECHISDMKNDMLKNSRPYT